MKNKLQSLKAQLPDPAKESHEKVRQWWQVNGQNWREKLRTIMNNYREFGHDWQFSDGQQQRLRQYYEANELLIDCLNSNCSVSPEVRQEIEDTLLLPIAEI